MEHGKVTSTKYESGAVYCDVLAIRNNVQYSKVPVLKSHPGFIQLPKQGETVTMEKLNDGTRLVSNILGREEQNPDSLREGELVIQLDNDTRIYFEKKNNGDHDLHLGASGEVSAQDFVISELEQRISDLESRVSDLEGHTHG